MPTRPRRPAGLGRAAILLVLLVASLMACGGTAPILSAVGTSAPALTASATLGLPTPGLASGTPTPGTSATPAAGGSGSPSPSATAAAPSGGAATPTPSATGPAGSASPNPAAGCTGSADNQAFFAQAAVQLSWSVYCAVLPAGWFFQQGSYELDAGGQLTVTYRGPAGAHLQLQQGAFCTAAATTAPSGVTPCTNGTAVGSTAYGNLTGQLVAMSPGYAVYVSPGQPPSWAAASVDLDEATFVRLVAALQAVPKP